MRVWARGRLETADNKLRIAVMDGPASVGGEVLVKKKQKTKSCWKWRSMSIQ